MSFFSFTADSVAQSQSVSIESGTYVTVRYGGDTGNYPVTAETTVEDVVAQFADDFNINVNNIRVKKSGVFVSLDEQIVADATYSLSQNADDKGAR